jgi:hypothetical protein
MKPSNQPCKCRLLEEDVAKTWLKKHTRFSSAQEVRDTIKRLSGKGSAKK